MTDQDQKLAYLLDDQPDGDANGAIDEIVGDVNLQYRMRRYQLIGDVMRHELPQQLNTGFHNEVLERIREEATPVAPGPAKSPVQQDKPGSVLSWITLKPLAGLAVAASVAIVTVAIWQPAGQDQNPEAQGFASADQQKIEQLAKQKVLVNAVPASTQINAEGMHWKTEIKSPGLQQKLNGYLVNHTEYSNPVQGLIPQARVAGFDTQQ